MLKNAYTDGSATLANSLPRPKAILCVFAHWYLPGTAVTAMPSPRHDFGGFPRELCEVEYPAPGSPELARRVRELLTPLPKSGKPGIGVELDQSWGLDHGAWSVLCHVFPHADIPVVQLSINDTRAPEFHYQVGKLLRPLRDEGVLIIGSGNIIHNLHTYAWGKHEVKPFDWAVRFEKLAREFLLSGNDEPLVRYEALGRDALLSAPTPDHYLPLLYVIALRREGEPVSFPVEGFDAVTSRESVHGERVSQVVQPRYETTFIFAAPCGISA